MIRQRVRGELIAFHDVIDIDGHGTPAYETSFVGAIVPPATNMPWAVYTSEPVTTLQEPFPARPAKPACACGDVSSYEVDGAYVCRPCFDDMRECGL